MERGRGRLVFLDAGQLLVFVVCCKNNVKINYVYLICAHCVDVAALYIRYFEEKFVPLHPENGLVQAAFLKLDN